MTSSMFALILFVMGAIICAGGMFNALRAISRGLEWGHLGLKEIKTMAMSLALACVGVMLLAASQLIMIIRDW